MRAVISLFGSLFFVLQRVIFTPILLGWMIGCMCLGAMVGSVIAYFIAAPIFGTPPGQTAWEWVIYGPLIFVGVVFGFRDWLMRSGADGLLIGRNPHTGRLLRYDGPAHLITLAPTRAGKGVAKVLSRSDFHFSDLRHRITSVFLVLPPNRMDAYSRWLRLLVSQALQDIARDAEVSATLAAPVGAHTPSQRLKTPTLFLLDEFASLGRLEAVERAMGLMAGYGLQLWPILLSEAASRKRSGGAFRCRTVGAQSQINDLYGERAGTFIANAGVQLVFGVNDFEMAKWLSQMMGQETTGYQTDSYKPGDAPSFSNNITGRDLLTPDEIMQLRPENQLLRVQGQATAVAQKLRYYADPEFAGLFAPQDN